jgi:diguanylate cyclase (GGDEF)-like protein
MSRRSKTGRRIGTLLRENRTLRNTLTRQAAQIETLRAETLRDALTGLANRTGLRHAWTQHHDQATGIIVIDVDRFKQINDRYGHHVGDIVLCLIAEKIQHSGIIGARTGGDEYICIVTSDDPEQIAETLRTTIREPIEVNGNVIIVTVSIGLALVTDQTSMSEHIERADSALYASKRVGRDSVTIV